MPTEFRDLVVFSLPGVQRLIGEARSTADLRSGSRIVAGLARAAAASLTSAELVIPHRLDAGAVPNRIVALVAAGTGPESARGAAAAVAETWKAWHSQVFQDSRDPRIAGFPEVQWVSVPAGDYSEQWSRAQRLLVARRRVRDFAAFAAHSSDVCSLSPRWPAVTAPPRTPAHEQKDVLSAVNWVKRQLPRREGEPGFPSTASIASAPCRAALANDPAPAALGVLHRLARDLGLRDESAVPGLPNHPDPVVRWFLRSGGPWIYPDAWNPASLAAELGRDEPEISTLVREGFATAKSLPGTPGDHLAVVVQDLDNMGLYLSGVGRNARGERLDVTAAAHQAVAAELAEVAAAQEGILAAPDVLGVPIYLGGDDLLAFVPAANALTAAGRVRDALRDTALPSASTAVLYFHRGAGLQGAVAQARQLLDDAKRSMPGKDALAVGYLRRSGVSETSIQPWATDPIAALGAFTRDSDLLISPRLIGDLSANGDGLVALGREPDIQVAELRRLVARHSGRRQSDPEIATMVASLVTLGLGERSPDTPNTFLPAARVGVFLRQEAR